MGKITRQEFSEDLNDEVNGIQSDLSTHKDLSATTSTKGHVQLSSSVASTSNSVAATASAVKNVKDQADGIESDLSTHKAVSATTSATGHVQLSSSVASTSTTLASTASATKAVNDNLIAHAGVSATTSTKGHVQLSSSVASTSTTLASTASATKAVNDNLIAHAGVSATTSTKGHVQLSSSLTSTSTTLAATASAAKSLKDSLDLAQSNFNSSFVGDSALYVTDVLAAAVAAPGNKITFFTTAQGTTNLPDSADAWTYSSGLVLRRAANFIIIVLFYGFGGRISMNTTNNGGTSWTGWKTTIFPT